jgi:hypothetical protein
MAYGPFRRKRQVIISTIQHMIATHARYFQQRQKLERTRQNAYAFQGYIDPSHGQLRFVQNKQNSRLPLSFP